MRLTLRTLLAYRDGVLSPNDKLVLESKLRESAMGREISNRIDRSLKNPKLAPIPIDAKENGFDANQIAEYLDDTMPADQVPDLERRCLENNALLSEVGGCHSILSKALNETVEVSSLLRERVRAIPTDPNQGVGTLRIHKQSTATEPLMKEAMLATPVEPKGRGIELHDSLAVQVPEYLVGHDRLSYRRFWMRPELLAVGVAALMCVATLLAIGPLSNVQELLAPNRYQNKQVDAPVIAKTEPTSAPNTSAATSDAAGRTTPDSSKPGTTSKKSDLLQSVEQTVSKPATPSIVDGKIEVPPAPDEVDSSITPNITEETQEEAEETSSLNPGPSNGTELKSDSSDAATTLSSPQAVTQPTQIQWMGTTTDGNPAVVFYKSTPTDSINTPENWAFSQSPPEPMKGVPSVQEIIVPFAYRTELTLSDRMRAITCGDTSLKVNDADQIEIRYGRLILFPTQQSDSVSIATPVGLLELKFDSIDASCALNVGYRWKEWDWMPGNAHAAEDPNWQSTEPFAELIGVQGITSVRLLARDDASENVETAQLHVAEIARLLVGSAPVISPMVQAPNWLRTNIERPIDQHAARDVLRALQVADGSSPLNTLRELYQHRRHETAVFAARILSQMGDFQFVFGDDSILRRPGAFNHFSTWVNKIPDFVYSPNRSLSLAKSFRVSETRDLEAAGNQQFAAAQGREELLLRLLIPMSNQQLAAGGDKLLVESLSSTFLDERTLAISQLMALRGTNRGFHPERSTPEAIQAWRQMLSKSEIRNGSTSSEL